MPEVLQAPRGLRSGLPNRKRLTASRLNSNKNRHTGRSGSTASPQMSQTHRFAALGQLQRLVIDTRHQLQLP